MLIGYMRVSKADGSQANDLQRDALIAAGVDVAHLYEDCASGKREDRPGLIACLKALRPGDALVVWKLDRLGRDLRHLINTVHEITGRGIGLKVLTGHGATIDTTIPAKLRLAMAAMGQSDTKVNDLCRELNITRQTLYRHVSPKGELRPDGVKLLSHT
jgi:DNA invertase Pin-like site-specific DNA recombinase